MSFRTKWGISVLRFFELRPQNDNMAVICVHLCPIRFCSCIFFSTPSHIICPIVIWASPFSPNASICNSLSFLPSRLNLWFKISASLIISHLPQDFKTFCVLILFNYGKDVYPIHNRCIKNSTTHLWYIPTDWAISTFSITKNYLPKSKICQKNVKIMIDSHFRLCL